MVIESLTKMHTSLSDCNTLFLVCTREDGLVSVLDIMKAGEAVRSARNTLQQKASARLGSKILAKIAAGQKNHNRKLKNRDLYGAKGVDTVCLPSW